ncbi:GL22214 [Drosophila persimilis]|uniref:GL22214 n=1 Tax=Drosophila persimilis TaxID=7234 RepID=B4GFH7_DROPE|nr:GL22214 [Drosophila persimilis]
MGIIGLLLLWTYSYYDSINVTRFLGESVGIIGTGDSEKPRNTAVYEVSALLDRCRQP